MISVQEAQECVKKHSKVLQSAILPIAEALDHVLVQDVNASIALPPFDSSAMDGYAVKFAKDETTFEVIGEVQAGSSQNVQLQNGQAVRIFTGANVPLSASAVVMQELATVKYNQVFIEGEIKEGSNIRRKGEQIANGELALSKGTYLTAAGIGFLASLGITEVDVVQKPKIRVLITGNELIQPGTALQTGQIYESNGATLAAAIKSTGFELETYSVVEDDFDATLRSITNEFQEADMLIVSGGISVGDYDFVGSALNKVGVEEYFYKIKQKPGKPLFFGGLGDKLCFALPGNPASALSCFYNYVLPALRLQSGWTHPFLSKQKMICKNAFTKKGDRAQFLKASIAEGQVTILEGQGSAMLHSFALANALVFLDEASGNVNPGDAVSVILLP